MENLHNTNNEDLIRSAKIIEDVIINSPNCKFSLLLKKIFYTLTMGGNEDSEKLLLSLLKKVVEEFSAAPASNNLSARPKAQEIKTVKPVDKQRNKLLEKCLGTSKPSKKVVFADLCLKVKFESYKEVKDVLVKVFGLSYNDFSGVTKTSDPRVFSFLMEEDALLKYAKELPNQDAGSIRPWRWDEIGNKISIITLICNKITENKVKNKDLLKSALHIANLIIDGDIPEKNRYTVEEQFINRFFPVRQL